MNSTWITPTRAPKETRNSENDQFLVLTPHNANTIQRTSLQVNTGDTSWQGTTYKQNNDLTSPVAVKRDIIAGKDDIIEQKDIIVQKQKMIITQLRQTNSELEELLLEHQRNKSSFSIERMEMRLKEYQYQVSHLQKKVHEERQSRQNEIDKLNRKLGEKEYEFGQLTILMKEAEISYNSQINQLKNQLENQLKDFKKEKVKLKEVNEELQNVRQEKASLERYLEDLPSNEEFQDIKLEVKELRNGKVAFSEEKELLESRLAKTQEDLKTKFIEINKLSNMQKDMNAQYERLHKELEKYKKQDELGPVPLKEHVKLQEELKHIKKRKEEMKLSLEKRNKKLTYLHYEILEKEKSHKIELEEKEKTIESLNDTLVNKNGIVSTVTAANHRLDETCKDLQSRVDKLEDILNENYKSTFQDFINENDACLKDMDTFINLCKARLNGTEPTINALLGIEDSPEKPTGKYDFSHPLIDAELLVSKKETLSTMRQDIEEIRHLLSDQYAEKISQNMCITQ